MATPPTRVSYNVPASGNYTSTTTPKTTPTFDVVSGDIIVVLAQAESATTIAAVTPSASGGTVTWTARTQFPASANGNTSLTRCWTGAVGATATGITVSLATIAQAADFWGFSATLLRAHGGVGQVFTGGITTGQGAPSVAVACSANSGVFCAVNDWNAVDGSGRVWRTINGSAETETLYLLSAARHTAYGGYRIDTGTAATITQGLTAPATMRWSLSGVEILGVAASGVTGTAASAGTGTISATGIAGLVATAALAATATIAAAGVVDNPGSASLAGTGSIAAAGEVGKTTTASLAGTGTITAGGTVSGSGAGTASVAGTGSVTASGVAGFVGTTNLAGTGSVASAGLVAKTSTASLAGTGAITAAGSTSSSSGGTASIAGAATLNATGMVARSGTATLAGTAALATNGVRATTSTAAIAGTGTTSASGARGAYSTAAIVGTAAFAVTNAGLTGSAALQGLGAITAQEFDIPPLPTTGVSLTLDTGSTRGLTLTGETRDLEITT